MKLIGYVEKEAIGFFQPDKLIADDANKCRANESVVNWSLKQTSNKEINVVYRTINMLQEGDHL